MNLDLITAEKMAAAVIESLAPLCHPGKCVVAGSIRRRRPIVHDVDIVCIPTDYNALRSRCLERCDLLTDGRYNLIIQTRSRIQIDIFIAEPEERDLFGVKESNWGSLLLCRTGSMAHNIHLCEIAKQQGLKWDPYWGVYAGANRIASSTEEDIFNALNIPYIIPEDRER